MTSRETLCAALNHKSGRIPLDFGATPTTGIHVSVVGALRDHFGLESRPVKVHEPYQMLGFVEDDLLDAMGIDTVAISPRKNIFGFTNEDWREFRLPWEQVVLVPGGFQTSLDDNGDLLIYPEGDVSVPPSGRMPVGGFFFDTIVRQEPIDEDALDPVDNLEEFDFAGPEDIAHVEAEVRAVQGSDRARIANFGGTGFGDIALVPAPFLKHPKGIRDIEEWYVSTLTRQDYIHAIFEKQCEIALANLDRFHAIAGDEVDVLFECGTDFGTQQSTFCSPATFDGLYAPYYKRVNDWVHANTSWKTLKHSCGAVRPLIPNLIECGFDILNPVQCSAAGMEAAALKADFGEKIVFWGGGVDTQKTLPFGTPEEVRAEVTSRCETLSRDGGFVFNTVHNVQARTPIENVVAMIDALNDFHGRA